MGLRGCGRADSDGLLLQGFAVLWVLAQGLFRAVSWIYGFISESLGLKYFGLRLSDLVSMLKP